MQVRLVVKSVRICAGITAGCLLALPLAGQRQHKKPAPIPAAPVAPAPATPPAPTNLLEQPPLPATVTERNNSLAVKADNSSLRDILRQVASQTGMKLDGLGGDERVFGSFGPGAPREVLTSLLNGTGYNVLMVGDLPNGAPRQLVLMRKSGGASAPDASASAGQPAPQPHTGEDDDELSNNEDQQPDSPQPMPTILPADPNEIPGQPQPGQPGQPPPGEPGQTQPGQPQPQVRTPQQILQQIQQQRNQPNTNTPE